MDPSELQGELLAVTETLPCRVTPAGVTKAHGLFRFFKGEIVGLEPALPLQDHCFLEHGLQLADVARPAMGGQPAQRPWGHAFDGETVVAVDLAAEVFDEERQVLGPLAERRDSQHDTPEPVEEVLSEPLLAHPATQVAVSGGEDADVGVSGACGTDRPDLARGQESEQHDLRLRREVADLVEKDGPAVRDGQKARMAFDGARERAALVAKELAPEELTGQAPAVIDHCVSNVLS
jgi:hypothetical protein